MSEEDIERLLAERSLARETFTDDVIAAIWTKAAASFTGASLPSLASDSAFQLIYTAALQATFATLAAHGLRVKSTANHYRSFFALQKLSHEFQRPGRYFDEMRTLRHASVYEPTHDEAELAARLSEARVLMPPAMETLRSAIIAVRPGIEARLPHIR